MWMMMIPSTRALERGNLNNGRKNQPGGRIRDRHGTMTLLMTLVGTRIKRMTMDLMMTISRCSKEESQRRSLQEGRTKDPLGMTISMNSWDNKITTRTNTIKNTSHHSRVKERLLPSQRGENIHNSRISMSPLDRRINLITDQNPKIEGNHKDSRTTIII
jgi:hypothetical protein